MFDGILLVVIGCALVNISPCFIHLLFEGFNTFNAAANLGELENWSIRIDYQDLILQSALEVEHG